MSEPVVLFPRAITAGWEQAEPKRHRLVIPANALDQFAALPVPDEELRAWDIAWLDGSSVEVLNLVDRKRWRIRRAQCGLGCCACDGQAWPVDYVGPIPGPEPFDGWPFYLAEDMWDALAEECGRDVSELGWDDLLAAVAGVRGAAG